MSGKKMAVGVPRRDSRGETSGIARLIRMLEQVCVSEQVV